MRKNTEPHDEDRHDEGRSVRSGFTLIELLVVIAIIGILAALLLPVLTRAKMRAQSVQCMSNSKQLALGWIMYADDNQDLAAPNEFPFTTSYFLSPAAIRATMQNWVVGTMEQPSDSKIWQELSISTANLHTNTVMVRYIANAATYQCPADHYVDPFSNTQHVRSYSMNSAVGTVWYSHFNGGGPIGAPVPPGWINGDSYNSPGAQTWMTFGKTTAIKSPSQIWVFLDENPFTINDGSYAVSANASMGHTYLIDYPSANHGGAGGMAFADGHSIIHRWIDKRTTSPQLNGQPAGQGSTTASLQTPDDPDCFFLAPITSYPK